MLKCLSLQPTQLLFIIRLSQNPYPFRICLRACLDLDIGLDLGLGLVNNFKQIQTIELLTRFRPEECGHSAPQEVTHLLRRVKRILRRDLLNLSGEPRSEKTIVNNQ